MGSNIVAVGMAVLAAAAVGCAEPEHDAAEEATGDRLVGGDRSEAWKSVGFIAFEEPVTETVSTPHCTGTVIAPRVVLTAAHCFNQGTSAVFGLGKFRRNGDVYRGRIVKHPDYGAGPTRNLAFDVAYMVLDKDVRVPPMPVSLEPHAPSCEYEAVGYGVQREGYTVQPGPIPDDLTGARRLGRFCAETGYGDRGTIQVRGQSAALCVGDSGGPLIHVPTGTLVGVANRIADRTCDRGDGAFYIAAAKQAAFVREALSAR